MTVQKCKKQFLRPAKVDKTFIDFESQICIFAQRFIANYTMFKNK